MKSLGQLLKELRGKRSLRDIAEETQLSHTYIADIEKGYRRGSKTPIKPSPDTLKRLAVAYDYSYEKLMSAAGYIEETQSHEDRHDIIKKLEGILDDLHTNKLTLEEEFIDGIVRDLIIIQIEGSLEIVKRLSKKN